MQEELESRNEASSAGPEENEDRRPTPVRLAMEGGNPGDEPGEEAQPRIIRDPETGRDWVVSVTGRSGSGILPIRSVPIMEVTFSEPGDPRSPLRRAMEVEEDLDTISDQVLLASLRRSRPFSQPLRGKGDGDPRGRAGRGRRPRRS